MSQDANSPVPQEGKSPLEMSDEELASMSLDFLDDEPAGDVAEASDEPAQPAEEETPAATEAGEEDNAPDAEDDLEPEPEDDAGEPADEDAESGTPAKTDAPADPAADEAAEGKETPESATDEKPDAGAIDYQREYERIMAPFKANGRDLQVRSVDEAIELMQMGANYNKKMAALKPNLKMMRLLEEHSLLDEQKLGYLIDLEKKNPEAIRKLVKDSGIDPLDIDTQKESEYRPSSYAVDDRQMELDSVLDDLQGSQTYNQLLSTVKQWDDSSKQVIADHPQLLKLLDSQMANGIYERISTEVERERTFGRLTGVSDLQAYKQVGDAMQERGAFNDLTGQGQQQADPAPATPPAPATQPPKAEDPALKSKKRAAGSTRSTPTNQGKRDFDPLAMSDEEFGKLVNDKLL